ncbi:hypothetical protein, partial [Hydrogenibacillus schlegelii]|uniref:hypothetical protein n=1 Tax=Hydrogenibacillus schlegelii TaxID=1484 RepID=UPI0034A0809E
SRALEVQAMRLLFAGGSDGAGNLLKRRFTGDRIDLPAPVPVRVIRHWRWDRRQHRSEHVSSRAGA